MFLYELRACLYCPYLASSFQICLMSEKQKNPTKHIISTDLYKNSTQTQCRENVMSACAECSYICLFRFDVVVGEEACTVTYRAVPPLALSLAHQDHISLHKRQITGLWGLVRVQCHVFWKGKEYMNINEQELRLQPQHFSQECIDRQT